MNKFDELDEFMKQTDCELKVGLRKMYFDDGEWVVMVAASKGSRFFVVDRFLDAVPNALSDALVCLGFVEQKMHPTLGESPASDDESKPASKRVI